MLGSTVLDGWAATAFPAVVAGVVAAVVTASLAPLLVRYASERAAAQPLETADASATVTAMSRWRSGAVTAALAAASAVGPVLAGAAYPHHPSPVGVLALTVAAYQVLLLGAVVLALVDHDTQYIDTRTYTVTLLAAGALTVAAAVAGGDLGRLLPAAAVGAVTVAVFEGTNAVYTRQRGTAGLGFGDTLLVALTVALPAALSGSWVVGYVSVMVALLTAAAGWGLGQRAGRLTRESPFAFGPFLLAAWPAAWALTSLTGLS